MDYVPGLMPSGTKSGTRGIRSYGGQLLMNFARETLFVRHAAPYFGAVHMIGTKKFNIRGHYESMLSL